MFNNPRSKADNLSGKSLECKHCSGRVEMVRSWKSVQLHCRSCGAKFSWKDFENVLDEDWEEILGNIPCDRI